MEESIDKPLRAGLALYHAGEYHAAHDPWEHVWLDHEEGSDDERLLHGLIQLTAAVHHARDRNWSGAVGLARSGRRYLEQLPEQYRGVDVAGAAEVLDVLERDPERVERGKPAPIRYCGAPPEPTDLDLDELAMAVEALGETDPDYDGELLAEAVQMVYEEKRDGQAELTSLLFDFVGGRGPSRGFVYDQIQHRIHRRRREHDDVRGLFDP